MEKTASLISSPKGELTQKLPADQGATNIFGDVFGGWVSSQAVLAAEIRAGKETAGRVATVSIGNMEFVSPVLVGTVLSFYTWVEETGSSSIRIGVEVWGCCPDGQGERKITEVECVQVAIDAAGTIRPFSVS